MAEKKSDKQTIEELGKRYAALNKTKIQAETNLENAKARYQGLKTRARKYYDTDDPEELKAKLRQMEEENERRRAEYQAALDKIEADLAAVEKEYADVGDI